MIKSFIFSTISFFALSSCAQNQSSTKNKSMDNSITTSNTETTTTTNASLDTATFGTGCFWCTEAIFQQLKGVEKVTSGYSGGHVKNPTYEEVCSKTTGHAECLSIVYDKTKISFDVFRFSFLKRLQVEQKTKAEKYIVELNKSGAFNNPIVTTLEKLEVFYAAENYHQNYYNNNSEQGYCQMVIQPKLDKFQKVFKDKLKTKKS